MTSGFRSIVVVGSTGYIGQRIYSKLKDQYIVRCVDLDTEPALDLNCPEKFDFDFFDNDFVIITAAISSPDICAKEEEKANQINVIGTSVLIENALKRNCKVLFFSSDAVYGFNNKIVNEETETSGDTAYGRMKKKVEDQFKDNRNFKAIRLSYVFSKYDKFTSYLLSCAEEKVKAELFHPFYRNVVALEDVLEVVLWLLINWSDFQSAFLNVCGKELVSRVRIADEIKRCIKINLEYEIVSPDNGFYKNRPAILEMQSLYIDKILDSKESFSQKVNKQFILGGDNE